MVGALDAFAEAIERRVDLAAVNGRVFVNNASLGLYAKIVQSPEYRDAKMQTAAAVLPDLLGPGAEPIPLRFIAPDGKKHESAHVILVSNDPYQLDEPGGRGTRERLDLGLLGVLAATVSSAGGRSFMGIVVCCLLVAFGVPLLAQSNMGTWTLNVAKSTYSPNTPPKSSALTIATTGVTVDVALPTGAQHWTYGGTYDGKPVPVTGNPNADTASRKRLSPTTTETTFTKAGKVTSVNTAVVAADGKTMTITAKGITAEGQPMLNVQLYEKK